MISKRGISTIVATVLIILITVAAVAIIWAAIVPMINDKLKTGQGCLDAVSQLSIVTDEGYTCINDDVNGNISIQIKRGAKSFDLRKVQISISSNGSSRAVLMPVDIKPNEERVIPLANRSYAGASKVDIAPVITIGKQEQICDISSSATLYNC